MNGLSRDKELNRLRQSLARLRPKVGARIVKTGAAVALSAATADALHLATPHFAGIVSVLAVGPSVHRSLRQGVRQFVSAFLGASAGLTALYLFGPSPWVMGLIALLLMAFHVRRGWTDTLLVAVVIAINTMGTRGMPYWEGAFNQLALVTIGLGYGNLINLLFRPSHAMRSRHLLAHGEREVRRLLSAVYADLTRGIATPYPEFRRSIDEVRAALEEGKRVAVLVWEDQKNRPLPENHILAAFQTLESMVERVRDMSKTAQRLQPAAEGHLLARLTGIVLGGQRRLAQGLACHFLQIDAAFAAVERRLSAMAPPTSSGDFRRRATGYQLYRHLQEYYDQLKTFHRLTQDPALRTIHRAPSVRPPETRTAGG
ncbi:MAG: hypothetical protein IRY98_12580, partial [Alicyclobacillaceae bacterium]|nr:hypothetical protein [Alicyclobacillaceae bacterium]